MSGGDAGVCHFSRKAGPWFLISRLCDRRSAEPSPRNATQQLWPPNTGRLCWIEDGFGCVLVGKPRERLLALAEAVYTQAEGGTRPAPATSPPAKPPT